MSSELESLYDEKEPTTNEGIIRGIDPDLKKLGKSEAAKLGIPLYAWLNQAILEKLKREETK